MNTFTIEAHLGRANIKSLAQSDKLDTIISWWSEQTDTLKHIERDPREASRDLVIECLKKNKHHTDPIAAEMVCSALIWLTATGPHGPRVLPFMRSGGMTVIYEIARLEGKTYRFRTKFDEKTDRALAL